MPKKGENSKAVEAKVRKEATRKAAEEQKLKAADDAYWADDDKHIAKKQNRKEEKEKKRLDTVARKTTNKILAEEEAEAAVPKSSQPQVKITQAQIAAENERREAAARRAAHAASKPQVPKETPLEENPNKLPNVADEARTVDEALKVLSTTDKTSEIDRHPERRMKVAYAAFEELRLPLVKKENPSLRLTQLKQIIYTEWQKSPDNPMVKAKLAAYNNAQRETRDSVSESESD